MTWLRIALTLAFAFCAASASAHTSLRGSTPASGAVLAATPQRIVLDFHEPTRVASATAQAPGRKPWRLKVATKGAARTVVIASPKLALGRNEIRWSAISADGHVVDGAIILVVRGC